MTPHPPADDAHDASQRRRLRASERRETILDAAADVFAEAGYRAAKVSDVAARVGVTEPVVFQNFGSKAALFAAVLQRAAAQVRASLDDLTEAHGPASVLLTHVLAGPPHGPHIRAGHQAADPGHPGTAYAVLFTDAIALTAEPELAGPAREVVRTVAAHLTDLIRHAQAGGAFRPGADPEAAAWLMLSVLSARRLRAAAMPAGLEPAVIALAVGALADGTDGARPGGVTGPGPA